MSILQDPNVSSWVEITLKILLSCLLGGVIGFERESVNRPAGFRTHILVCVGSSLVMLTSVFIFETYKGTTNIDPARLGAQVISGIGFLGAGTIIREGLNVQGLTTAASLWAVACIGLAAGIGFYSGAVIATVIILLSLILFKRLEDSMHHRKRKDVLNFRLTSEAVIATVIAEVGEYFSSKNIVIESINFNEESEEGSTIKIHIRMPHNFKKEQIIRNLSCYAGIEKIF